MPATTQFGPSESPPAESQSFSASADSPLPLSVAAMRACQGAVLECLLRGDDELETLRLLCVSLARQMTVPLVTIGQRSESGAISTVAASSESGLWLELQRIQQRWDGGVTAQGAASLALAGKKVVRLPFDDEGLALWRAAAQREGVVEVLAISLVSEAGQHVLEVFFTAASASSNTTSGITATALGEFVAELLNYRYRAQADRLLARALESAGHSSFITDHHGNIVWSNRAFTALTGYSAEEVRGKSPRLLHSGEQGMRYYRELWNTIRGGKVWTAETVDCDKDGKRYTIRQTVNAVLEDGRVTHYLSVHEDISFERQQLARLERVCKIDSRTGLMTPAAFADLAASTLTGAVNSGERYTLLLISLRGLRRVNASLSGELRELLADEMGERLRRVLPAECPATALKDYEYIAVLRQDPDTQDVLEPLLKLLTEALVAPVLALGDTLDVDAHIGRAGYPQEGTDYTSLLRCADRKLADEPAARMRH